MKEGGKEGKRVCVKIVKGYLGSHKRYKWLLQKAICGSVRD